jgi:hypothetical protein
MIHVNNGWTLACLVGSIMCLSAPRDMAYGGSGPMATRLVIVEGGDCWCNPAFEDPSITLAGCFTLMKAGEEPAVERGWCDGPQEECILGIVKPRPCGGGTVDYEITHGGLGCCANAAGRAFGQTAPLPLVINFGATATLQVTFPAVGCGDEKIVAIVARCGQGVNGQINSSWAVKYTCDPCTLALR